MELNVSLYHSLGLFSKQKIDDIPPISHRKEDVKFQANTLHVPSGETLRSVPCCVMVSVYITTHKIIIFRFCSRIIGFQTQPSVFGSRGGRRGEEDGVCIWGRGFLVMELAFVTFVLKFLKETYPNSKGKTLT